MTLTNKERFHSVESNGHVFAPLTHGCAANIHTIDYSVFKKSLEEKIKVFSFKKKMGKTKNHKFTLQFKGAF